MKKLNKGRFLRAKSQIYDNEFHVTSFPGRTQNYPPPFLLFTFPPTHSFYSNPLSLTSNPPTIRYGTVIETRYGKLHVKLDNSENLKNLKKIVGLTNITLIKNSDKKERKIDCVNIPLLF